MLRQLEIIAANTVSAWFSETRRGKWPAGGVGRARPSIFKKKKKKETMV